MRPQRRASLVDSLTVSPLQFAGERPHFSFKPHCDIIKLMPIPCEISPLLLSSSLPKFLNCVHQSHLCPSGPPPRVLGKLSRGQEPLFNSQDPPFWRRDACVRRLNRSRNKSVVPIAWRQGAALARHRAQPSRPPQ
jgi:hypothetical protein